MMQITEDTPPDMLAGAMDLLVHLPNGKAVKMSVERSTPMMDLLVQITTANQLQLSNHTLQVLGMAPSSEHSDKILPFKPNTPIGTLDTQHIRVLPKGRTLPAPKYVAPGHQPFESTFRLKVHLPRNQLYVTRVSRNVLLEDIMKKVCDEKNLDPLKYDFKHPGNLDEVLDPKLTLSDYQITEIYVVSKGTTNLNQAFSATDIMVLRKEEERKQMHNKTGGGVFNLIFKRGKSSMGSGSVSSDNRSISPTHSDDSRSVTPPAVQAPPIVALPKKDPPPDRPKPPQRKRRPAPKPPQIQVAEASNESGENLPSVVSNDAPSSEAANKKTSENGLTICHSRNSSDSSGYHEASILSDHCANASLPRNRPKSAFVGDVEPLQSTSNLSKMSAHSRSTTSLVTGRKKKAAPPPPPVAVSPASSVVAQSEKPSPLVASQSDISRNQESVTSSNLTPAQTPHDSIPPCPLETSTPVRTKQEEKSIESTDSGIAQDTQFDRDKDVEEDFGFHTPPPPPILDDITEDASVAEINFTDIASVKESVRVSNETEVKTTSFNKQIPMVKEPENITEAGITKPPAPPIIAPPIIEEARKDESIKKQVEPEAELADIDWQYQLPSPPKAFRDSSPTNLAVDEIHSVSDFKDSIVTSPELFERLKSLEDNQSEKEILRSEATSSVASEEPLNTLSLEHLEKRKSLVYNRELATSLKMTDNIETNGKSTDASSHTGFQTGKAGNEVASSKPSPKPTRTASSYSHHHTLPNFKITTYDVPKHQNIKVFEDDTIRSNTHGFPAPLRRNQFGHSMENISFAKNNSIDENKEKEYNFYKAKPTQTSSTSVSRSGSFSTDNKSPLKPVSRSKSTLTLNKYQAGRRDETNISRSNSLFDVSGLQSLEVMRLIQNKLNTPVGSVENINARNQIQTQQFVTPAPVPKIDVMAEETPRILESTPVEEKPQTPPRSPEPVKKYYYRGPPAVNMSTWSERPKVPVAVKEDEDYKLGNVRNITSKLIVNTTNNNISSNNSIEVRGNGVSNDNSETRNIETNRTGSIMTSTEQITHKTGNVVIKIGSSTQSSSYIRNMDNQRLIGPTGYKKPFTSLNRNDENNITIQRPHSIALPSDFNISRVPVVRSVEFKKPFKDLHGSNTSITHLNRANDEYSSLHQYYDKPDSFAEKFRNDNIRNVEKQESEPVKRSYRVGSFKPVETNAVPIVRGFKHSNNNNDINKRLSWNPPTTYSTLPAKPKMEKEYNINQHVPFSQSTLRRTESSRLYAADQSPNDIRNSLVKNDKSDESSYKSLPPSLIKSKFEVAPPPPPQMPKVASRKVAPKERSQSNSPTDARDMLLESIRNFGGKKGLKAVKA